MSAIPTTLLAGKTVGRMGFGLMQLTGGGSFIPSEEDSLAVLKAAADAGATAWSTACFYGRPPNSWANVELIGKFFKKYPTYSDKVVLVLKGGMDHMRSTGDIEKWRAELKHANELIGRPADVYSLARLHRDLSLEESFTQLKTLRDEGLFREVGASEMKRESLERASKIVPIATVEIEVSLTSFEPEIRAVVDWSRETHVPVFAYSPLGRGMLAQKFRKPEDIPKGSFQSMTPRFQGQAFLDNVKFVERLDAIAQRKGIKTPQLALAWLINLHDYMLPIPGTLNVERVKENTAAALTKLSAEDMAEIGRYVDEYKPAGARYPEAFQADLMQ